MLVPFENDPAQMQLAAAARELEACNRGDRALRPGALDGGRAGAGRRPARGAARSTDRVEFGGGVAKQLVLAFAGSPHVSQATFVETVLELQELFYEFKNESLEQIPDDELIGKMRSLFDDVARATWSTSPRRSSTGSARHVREEMLPWA